MGLGGICSSRVTRTTNPQINYNMRLILILFLCVFPLSGGAFAQVAADTTGQERYSFTTNNTPLQEALTSYSTSTKIAVVFSQHLVHQKFSNCVIQNATATQALTCLIQGTGLTFQQLSTGTIKLSPSSIPTKNDKKEHTISGYIRDANSGEALIQAAIFDQISGAGVTSNAYGFYSLTLPEGPVALIASYVGYNRSAFKFDLIDDYTLQIELTTTSLGMDTLVVEAAYEDAIEEQTQMGVISIPIEQIEEMPSLLGEPDVLRAVQLLPGVQSGNEGTTGLYVRGGSVDQNLFLLDGVTVYNPSHLFGFLSVFHTRALNDMTLVKGGFPARYGGRLSSVLDISMKEGNAKQFAGAASLGIAASSITLEGPIKKDESSFIVSARRSLVDVALQPFAANNNYPSYALFDFNGKLNHRFSNKDRVYASIYGGNDRYQQQNNFEGGQEVRNEFNIQWGNTIGALRWNHLFSDKLFSNLAFQFSRYHLETAQQDVRVRDTGSELVQERFRLAYESGVQDLGVKLDFDLIPSPSHYIRFGAHLTNHLFTTGALQLNEGPSSNPARDTLIVPLSDINSWEGAAYAEDDIKIGRALSINLGVHASAYAVNETMYTSLQPRLAVRISLPFQWALKASYAKMTQYLHLLVNSGIGLPTDLWLPATDRIKPQHAEQIAIGLAHTIGADYELSIEAYDKRMRNLIEYKEGAGFLNTNADWQDKVETGSGRSYGIELLLQKKKGRTSGWIGYTLSRSDRTFAHLNEGQSFPFKYDRRHDLAITVLHKLNEKISLSGSWVYGTGNAVTISNARFLPALFADASSENPIFTPDFTLQQVGRRNEYRMQPFHRLDLSANFTWPARKGTHLLTLGAYNAYNRKNPYFLFIEEDQILDDADFIVDYQTVLKQASLFPLLPSLSYQFEF